jgi:hypothetical protein
MVCASILMCHSLGHAAQQLGERDVWGHVWGYTELQNRENPASMRTSANDGNPPLRQNTKALDFQGLFVFACAVTIGFECRWYQSPNKSIH